MKHTEIDTIIKRLTQIAKREFQGAEVVCGEIQANL
jgi:hypothetical protein